MKEWASNILFLQVDIWTLWYGPTCLRFGYVSIWLPTTCVLAPFLLQNTIFATYNSWRLRMFR